MSETELQDWLYETSMREELQQLGRVTTLLELDNVAPEPELADITFDWPRLLLAASILARSKKRLHREASLRIATGAMLLPTSDPVRDAAAVLFDKLSNRRSVALAEQRGRLKPDLESRLGVALRIEDQRKQIESSILLEATGERLPVNEFQLEFWQAAGQERAWLSASAPTASGKTFLVLKWLVDCIATEKVQRAVYLAPTRALVSKSSRRSQKLRLNLGSISKSPHCPRRRNMQPRRNPASDASSSSLKNDCIFWPTSCTSVSKSI